MDFRIKVLIAYGFYILFSIPIDQYCSVLLVPLAFLYWNFFFDFFLIFQ
jgi:hypothetical protein